MPTYDFTGKTAFVTGGSAGMGAATVRAFAEETAEAFDTIVAVNLRGVWASMKYELRQVTGAALPVDAGHTAQ
ncbi:hypothetical protein [Salana multivorans]